MQKATKRTIIGLVIGALALAIIGFLPPETEAMSRAAWQYLGIFVFMLVAIISRALPDWASVLMAMALLVVFKVGAVKEVTAQFASSTVWLCISVFIMSIGVNNSGIMKRLALWILTKFPGTYSGQVTAMMLAGVITTPIIPSSTAKTSIMAPLIGQVCDACDAKPGSKQSLGLWFANFMGTMQLGMGFMSGSVYVAIMLGFIGESLSWGRWFTLASVWYVVCIVLTYLFCRILCKPADNNAGGNVEFIKEQFKALGKFTTKEKQCTLIILCALVLWLTQSVHGIDAGMIAILADVAFVACGLITGPEVGSKAMWTTTLFVGGVLSVAGMMSSLGINAWVAGILGPIFAPILSSPYIFVPVLCILTYILRYAVVSMSCSMAIMIAIFAPLLPQYGINLFVLVFVSWVSSTEWNAPYLNPVVTAMVKLTGGAIDDKTAQKGSYAFCIINLIAMTASVPLWQALGMC